MSFGVTTTGFVKKALSDILSEVQAQEIAQISPTLDVGSDQPIGQINGIVCAQLSECWDLLQAVYTAMDPAVNTGDAQDAIAAITGSKRNAATYSQAKQVTVTLNAGITLTAGVAAASVLGNPNARFVLVGLETVLGTVVAGNVTNSGGSPANFACRFQAASTGPVIAATGTLTVIATPTSGWTAVTNPTDAVLGSDIETASAFRVRRDAEVASTGADSVDAVRADVLKVPGVVSCSVTENTGDSPDAFNRLPHSVETLIYDGVSPAASNDAIAQAIWNNKGGGIYSFGAYTGNATDTAGVVHQVAFNRATQKTVYFGIDIKIDATKFPVTGDADIKNAIVAFGMSLMPNQNVTLAAFYPVIFSELGVIDIPAFRAGFTASPAGVVNLTIGLREIATFDTSRIVINHV